MKFEIKNVGQRKILHREGELLPGVVTVIESKTYNLLQTIFPGEVKLLKTIQDETPKKTKRRGLSGFSNNS